MTSYKTISKYSEAFHKVKGSKFYAYAWPVQTESDIKNHLEELKLLHPKARHHCYAWRLGLGDDKYRINDAGEPSGTAGKPIFGQIRSKDLRNILVVVVRYFGGTKLGVPGLISAYKIAADACLKAEEPIIMEIQSHYSISFPYLQMNPVMKHLKKYAVKIREQKFDTDCQIEFSLNQSDSESLILALEKLEGLEYEHLSSA